MSALAADSALLHTAAGTPFHAAGNAEVVARLERLPVTARLMLLRVIVGIATFFDAYTSWRSRLRCRSSLRSGNSRQPKSV